MTSVDHDLDQLLAVREWLSDLAVSEASAVASAYGFGWVPDDDAPDDFVKLLVAHDRSVNSGVPLRVATVNAEPSIFTSADANYAMRFWHDMTHLMLGEDFGFAGEAVVAKAHLAAVESAGHPAGSLAWRMLRTDTVGQNLVFAMTGGGFVANQLEFAVSSLRSGLPFAVLEAIEQIEGRRVESSDMDRLGELLAAAAR